MRLPRPYIPLAVRVKVAERQLREAHPLAASILYGLDEPMPLGKRLRRLLAALFPVGKVELHHRPALTNRRRYQRNPSAEVKYIPPANSPDHLVYLLKDDHDIETRVRGQNGQHSDLALARKRKRKERKERRPKHPGEKYWRMKRKLQRRWPKGRRLQSRNTLRKRR
jgi:hypothetical protein